MPRLLPMPHKAKGPLRLFALAALLLLPVVVMAPLYGRGYLLLLDMVWGPMSFADPFATAAASGLTAIFPLQLFFGVLRWLLPVAVIQQLFLTLILLLATLGAFLLTRRLKLGFWAYLAGVLYLLNPYVYERFLAGHYLVLLGYAVFPFFIAALLAWRAAPTPKSTLSLFILTAIYPVLSLHWAYIGAGFGALLLTVIWLTNTDRRRLWLGNKKLVLLTAALAAVAVIFNLYWLQPDSRTQEIIRPISTVDFEAFQTRTDPGVNIFFQVLSLYGFWQDDFILPKHYNAFWSSYTLILLVFAGIGLLAGVRQRQPLAITLALTFVPVLCIAVGYGSELTRPLIDLLRIVPGFDGLRETQKLAGLLAFTFALMVPAGLQTTLTLFPTTYRPHVGLLLGTSMTLLVFLQMAPMLTGFVGQLRPADYPLSWYQAEKTLQAAGAQKLLFFPWVGYQPLPFANDRVTANPARAFFSVPVVTGSAFENGFLESESDPQWEAVIFSLLNSETMQDKDLAFLRAQGITHIVLAKINDFDRYRFLTDFPKVFPPVFDSAEIAVYALASAR